MLGQLSLRTKMQKNRPTMAETIFPCRLQPTSVATPSIRLLYLLLLDANAYIRGGARIMLGGTQGKATKNWAWEGVSLH